MTTADTPRTVRRPGRLRTITVNDPESDLHGLVIKSRGISLQAMTSLIDMTQYVGRDAEQFTTEEMGELLGTFDIFASALHSWNMVEDDDVTPVPATIEGIRSLEISDVLRIITIWMSGILGVKDDLKDDSKSGNTVPEDSIPMAAL